MDLLAATAADDGFLAVGYTCETAVLSEDGEDCFNRSPVSFHLDPSTERWSLVDLGKPLGEGLKLQSVSYLGSPATGLVMADLRVYDNDRTFTDHVMQYQDGTWTSLRQEPLHRRAVFCATTEGLYILDFDSRGDDIATEPTRTTLTRVGKDGQQNDVPMPPVDQAYGAVTVTMGCTEEQPLLSSSPSAGEEKLYALANGTWSELVGVFPGGSLTRVLHITGAGEQALVQLEQLSDKIGEQQYSAVAVRRDGSATGLDERWSTARVVPAPDGQLIGITAPSGSNGGDPSGPSQIITLDK